MMEERPGTSNISATALTAARTFASRASWPSVWLSGTAITPTNPTTRAMRVRGERITPAARTQRKPSTHPASPRGGDPSCHWRAAVTTESRCIPTARKTAIPLSTIPARLAP